MKTAVGWRCATDAHAVTLKAPLISDLVGGVFLAPASLADAAGN